MDSLPHVGSSRVLYQEIEREKCVVQSMMGLDHLMMGGILGKIEVILREKGDSEGKNMNPLNESVFDMEQ